MGLKKWVSIVSPLRSNPQNAFNFVLISVQSLFWPIHPFMVIPFVCLFHPVWANTDPVGFTRTKCADQPIHFVQYMLFDQSILF